MSAATHAEILARLESVRKAAGARRLAAWDAMDAELAAALEAAQAECVALGHLFASDRYHGSISCVVCEALSPSAAPAP